MRHSDGTLLESTALPPPDTFRISPSFGLTDDERQRFAHIRMHAITYASAGLRIKAFLALPPSHEARMPALIFNRGGSRRAALTTKAAWQYLGMYASWGYVAIASQYRGDGGSEGNEEWGAGDADDVLNLLPLLHSLPYVDADRIGIVGGSRGGMLVYQVLRRCSALRAAVTIGAPSTMLVESTSAYILRLMMRSLPPGADPAAEAAKRSALLWADQLDKSTPLLLLHGSGDRRIEPGHSLRLAMALQDCRHPYKMIIYENADHILAGRRKESNRDIRDWVDAYVKRRMKLPRVGPHGA